MPVKYECPKCKRRFVDWGAEKLSYLCPDCAGVGLLRVGASGDTPGLAPTLSRRPDKAAAPEPHTDDNELKAGNLESEVDVGVSVASGDDSIEDDEAEEPSDDGEMPEDLDFDTAGKGRAKKAKLPEEE